MKMYLISKIHKLEVITVELEVSPASAVEE